jgi:hypothetical protein
MKWTTLCVYLACVGSGIAATNVVQIVAPAGTQLLWNMESGSVFTMTPKEELEKGREFMARITNSTVFVEKNFRKMAVCTGSGYGHEVKDPDKDALAPMVAEFDAVNSVPPDLPRNEELPREYARKSDRYCVVLRHRGQPYLLEYSDGQEAATIRVKKVEFAARP